MRLGRKHQNQFQVVRADFSGGLNTSATRDGIAENQLAIATNVEVDHTTGKLKTVAGTITVRKSEDIFAAVYDNINKKLLLVKQNKNVYALDLKTKELSGTLGTLAGGLYPMATSWEDGVLIASGGKLQYYNGEKLKTIDNSPTATSVYIRAGRVLVSDDTSVHFSGVGDEENWADDTDDASSSKFVEAGYKDGGKLLAMVNLSSDVLLIKDNHRVYRLSGEFPNWAMTEVSRNIEVSGRRSICTVADSVYVLGRNELQVLQTTADYGDVKPQNVAGLVTREIQYLPEDALLRFLPPLGQIWAIQGNIALIFDLTTNSWFKRQFNSVVVDTIPVGINVFVIKPDRVSVLSELSFYDSDKPLSWKWQGQRLISHYNYFLKQTSVSFSPTNIVHKGNVRVGAVVVDLPILNSSPITGRRQYVFSNSSPIYENNDPIYENEEPIFSLTTIITENRNVFRSKYLDISSSGDEGGITFNSITLDLVEV